MAQKEMILKRPSIFNQVSSWFSSLFTRRFWMFGLGNREIMPDINAETAITEGFNANAAVYSIVKKDINKFASIPRYVLDAKKLQEKSLNIKSLAFKASKDAILTNDLSGLINRPNEYQGSDAFFKAVRGFYKVCGEAFIWLNRGDDVDDQGRKISDAAWQKRPVLEMYVLPSNRVTIVPDPDNYWGLIGFIVNVNGGQWPIRKVDVIQWKDVNLEWDASARPQLRGMPALRPGASSLQQNIDASRASVRQYQNDGAKGVLFEEMSSGRSNTPEQQAQIKSVIDAKINNNDVKGAVATLQGKWGYLNFGGTSVDLELLEGKKFSWQELCFLFDVPYEFFDSNTTYANKEQAKKNWLNDSIIPACKELDDEMNRVLLRAFLLEGKALICSDASGLPEMQKDVAGIISALKEAWGVTPNQMLEAIGYESRPEAEMNEPWIPTGVTPLSRFLKEDDGFDEMMNELGIRGGNNYVKPTNGNGAVNGKKV
jgi:phage portal protein BeeE